MADFKQCFDAYGANYKQTLDRFMGNEKMYLKFLNMLFKDQSVNQLGDALAQGDLKAAFEAAHTLKGVSANLGLTPLFDAVCEIVEPLRGKDEGTDYMALYGQIRMEMDRAADFLSSLQN